MTPPKVHVQTGIIDAVMQANPFVQLLLLLMVCMSIISWAIILTKARQLSRLRALNKEFSDFFWKATSLEAVQERLGHFEDSNIANIFRIAFAELQKLAEGGNSHHQLKGIDNLERALRKAHDNEISLLESRISFLATTGSTAPFIGLLGTVIGIMTSFANIAASGSASLAVVAPGISEALFSTAVGLFAALPAVAAYNQFITTLRKMEIDFAGFASDFLNIAKRNFFKEV